MWTDCFRHLGCLFSWMSVARPDGLTASSSDRATVAREMRFKDMGLAHSLIGILTQLGHQGDFWPDFEVCATSCHACLAIELSPSSNIC